jgi:phage virion morphogenesis protein
MALISLTADHQSVIDALNLLAHRVTPAGMRLAMMEIGEDIAISTSQRFQQGIAPDGSSWAPLSTNPKTVLARIRRGRGHEHPLIDTGALSDATRSGPHWQITDGGARVVIGVNRHFASGADARVHQFGTHRAGRNRSITIPARPFLGLSAADEATVLEIIQSYLADAI